MIVHMVTAPNLAFYSPRPNAGLDSTNVPFVRWRPRGSRKSKERQRKARHFFRAFVLADTVDPEWLR